MPATCVNESEIFYEIIFGHTVAAMTNEMSIFSNNFTGLILYLHIVKWQIKNTYFKNAKCSAGAVDPNID